METGAHVESVTALVAAVENSSFGPDSPRLAPLTSEKMTRAAENDDRLVLCWFCNKLKDLTEFIKAMLDPKSAFSDHPKCKKCEGGLLSCWWAHLESACARQHRRPCTSPCFKFDKEVPWHRNCPLLVVFEGPVCTIPTHLDPSTAPEIKQNDLEILEQAGKVLF